MDRLWGAVSDLYSVRPSPWALGTRGGVLGASDSVKPRASCLSWGRWFFSDGLSDPRLLSDGPSLSRGRPSWGIQEALEAPQPFYPMDLESLQEGEVKQWPEDAVILLVGD